jgi:predicted deacylase
MSLWLRQLHKPSASVQTPDVRMNAMPNLHAIATRVGSGYGVAPNMSARTPFTTVGSGRDRFAIPVTTLASGYALSIPVLALTGAKPGPRVGVSAMVHGDEIDGLLVIRELWRTIDPADLSGSLWMMPVANPLAMEAMSRNTPIDMLDMNRLFPGQPDGWLSEQQAHAITTGFINELDYLVDIHAGGTFPWVDYCYALNDEAFSRAFLSALLFKPTSMYPATTASVALAQKIPICVVEMGGGYHDQDEHVRNGVLGVKNMLRHAGVLPGAVEQRPRQLLLHEIKVMRPRNGGVCVPHRKLVPGAWIEGTQPLADIVSPHTLETLETMVTPFEKNVVVLARNYATRIHPGDYGFMIGNGATATWYD